MSTLFVIPCSLTKATGGTALFEQDATIAAVAPQFAEQLTTRRDEVRELVRNGQTADWQGVPLNELDYNRGLVKGVDFGGKKAAQYLPALDRYEGRFYQAVGSACKAHCRSAENVLIVSGLYGLLRPSEPVQLYSCPLTADVADVWMRDGLLTDTVQAYITRNDILRVFDLTAIQAYRHLLAWDRITAAGTDVLHCFDSMAAGDSALTSFGRLFRYLCSLSEDELIALEPEDSPVEFGTSHLHRSTEPPAGYPVETWQPHLAAEVLRYGNPDSRVGPWEFTMSERFRRDAKGAFQETLRAVVEICAAPMSPRGSTVKRLTGHDGRLWRYRLGDRRFVYEPDKDRRVVRLLRCGHRGDVYSGL